MAYGDPLDGLVLPQIQARRGNQMADGGGGMGRGQMRPPYAQQPYNNGGKPYTPRGPVYNPTQPYDMGGKPFTPRGPAPFNPTQPYDMGGKPSVPRGRPYVDPRGANTAAYVRSPYPRMKQEY